MFKICARTVLELGAELISSDVIAFYELIKNAFDAESQNGAEIRFNIILRKNQYLKLKSHVIAPNTSISKVKKDIEQALDRSASKNSLKRVREKLETIRSKERLIVYLDHVFAKENKIIISDKGSGMSKQDIEQNYLVIGTPSRKKIIDQAIKHRIGTSGTPPFLGEKGIGRLSAMRLGDRLRVKTARKSDTHFNILEIDWSAFEDIDAMLDEIEIVPQRGIVKPDVSWCGTRLTISALNSDWTSERVRRLCENDFARLTDPFGDSKRRPRIAVFWNGTRIPVAHMDRQLLEHAHAAVKGSFDYRDDEPYLECTYQAFDLGFEHPYETEKRGYTSVDLQGFVSGTSDEVPSSALTDLGAFNFEIYWFNRKRLGRIDSIGDQKAVRDLQKRWSGILLFRDGFRVLPYGEDSDDWLGLDRRAMGSTGYLLNKAQFVGKVAISRLGNQYLIDQTNREGLRDCPEQQAFIELLQHSVQYEFRDFLRDIEKRYKDQPLDTTSARTDIVNLENRAKIALKQIRKNAPDSLNIIDELQHTFFEIKEFFDRAQRRISEMENENRQMIQMAGVGLLVEVVAHELARSTENALMALKGLQGNHIPDHIAGPLGSLHAEMTALSKRVRVLDPLSVSGRQRKKIFNIVSLISDTFNGHANQFERHNIVLKFEKPEKPIRVKAVEGLIVQILENLISNSLYWIDLRSRREPNLQPSITIRFNRDPLTITYFDNGHGIAPENREKVFRMFYSLKEKTKRRGLGLYIARECAEYHGGELVLDHHTNPDNHRLHRFVLSLPDEVIVS